MTSSRHAAFVELRLLLAALMTVVGVAAHSWFLTASAALLLAVLGSAWLWSRNALRGVHYTRRFSETRAFQGEEIELTLDLHCAGFRLPSQIDVIDLLPDGLPVDGKSLVVNPSSRLVEFRTHWAPGRRVRLSRRFRLSCPRRGLYRFGPATLQSGDPFGFFEQTRREETLQRVVVYPTVYTVEELRLPARTLFGDRLARLPLVEDPLRSAGVREWMPEDSVRRIHWNASLRTQTLQSRLYEPSEDLQVMVVLNVATMERHWQGVLSELHERAVSVAASIAAEASAQRLPVGLLVNGALPESDREIRLLPGRSPYQLMHLLELLAGVTPFATEPIEELIERAAPTLPRGATLVLVTAIAHEALLLALGDLAQAGRSVVLVTLAAEPPHTFIPALTVYHVPHLVDDLVQLATPDWETILAAQPFSRRAAWHDKQLDHEDTKPAAYEPSPWARPQRADAPPAAGPGPANGKQP